MVQLTEVLTLDNIDITSLDIYDRGYPHEAWALLRREAPVFWYVRPGFEPFWAVTKYEDIVTVERHPERFSNVERMRLGTMEYVDAINRRYARESEEHGCPYAQVNTIIRQDPPVHRQYRSITSKHFSPRQVARYTDTLQRLAGQYVATLKDTLQAADGRPVDFVREFARRLPVTAICSILGVPEADWAKVEHWNDESDQLVRQGVSREDALIENDREYHDYLRWLMKERRNQPADDLTTVIVNAEIDGQPLPERDLLDYMIDLFAAGVGTTRSSTTLGLDALLRHPAELERLVRDPSLVPTAVEELLRWTSVLIQMTRTCRVETELHGQLIQPGETVVLYYPSANRDEDVFEDPYRFDVTRDPNPQMAFGRGEHYCLGVNLARLEMRALFEAIVPLLPKIEVAGRADIAPYSWGTYKVRNLPIRLKESM